MGYIFSGVIAVVISLGYTELKSRKQLRHCVMINKGVEDRVSSVEAKLSVNEQEMPVKITKMLTPLAREIGNLKETVGV